MYDNPVPNSKIIRIAVGTQSPKLTFTIVQLLHTLRPRGIFTPRVVINTLFNEKECAIVVLVYRIGLITVVLAVD